MDMKILGPSAAQQEVNLLRSLFVEHMVAKLTDEAIAAIRPRIVEYARDVVREMEPAVSSQYNQMQREVVLQLSVKEPK
jgi:hypothetical protein